MTARIEDVLASRHPAATDENDWPEFALTEVKVFVPGKSRYASILAAATDSPVSVTGQLEPVDDDQQALILDGENWPRRVLLADVTHYAYGQDEDGDVGIWVAAPAGWFSIEPARIYRAIFNDMVQAIDLFYFLADKHRRRRGRTRKGMTLDYVLDEYTKHKPGVCADAEDAAEVVYKHHDFLIKQMIEGKENINWAETSIYAHLHEKYPDVVERIEQAVSKAESDSDTSRSVSSSSPEPNVIGLEQAVTILKEIVDMKNSGRFPKTELNIRTLGESLVTKYAIDSLDEAQSLICSRAGLLVEMMDKDGKAAWSRKGIYKELLSAKTSLDVDLTPLHPRAPAVDSSDDEGDSDEASHSKHGRRRARTSMLRPPGTLSAKKSAKRYTRQTDQVVEPASPDLEDSDMELDMADTPTRPRDAPVIHTQLPTRPARTALAPAAAITPADFDAHTNNSNTDSKANANHVDGTAEDDDAAAADGRIDADISHSNQFPPDTWVCSMPGCGRMVLRAHTRRGRDAVLDHSLDHADDTKSKLDLVFAEQRHNVGVSVGNLVGRIRDFAALHGDGLGHDGRDLDPDPDAAHKRAKVED